MTKIVALSDTHGSHFGIKIPAGDILVHAGDISSQGKLPDTLDFLRWFNTHPHRHKIFIAGNHDWIFEQDPNFYRIVKMEFPNLTYLQDESCECEGLKIYGSPQSPRFFNWAFNRDRGEEIKRYWDKIPSDTDVLVTHGPPYGYADEAYRVNYRITEHCGCKDLLDATLRIAPKLHLFGHIHYSAGQTYIGTKTTYANVSVLDEAYLVSHKPMVFDIDENKVVSIMES
jgi:Icc-related predicted phosphoesterase